jgi:hypothetical protein
VWKIKNAEPRRRREPLPWIAQATFGTPRFDITVNFNLDLK